MIELRNVFTIDGKKIHHFIQSKENICIDATNFILFPALIDPHVHFCTPGHEHKENWKTAAKAALKGGVTCVLDMPNNDPACINLANLLEKEKKVFHQLKTVEIPLRYFFFIGADKHQLEEIESTKDHIVGIKVFMSSSTGTLLINENEALERVFQIAEKNDLIVAIHAEDEKQILKNRLSLTHVPTYKDHSFIRNPEAAKKALQKALQLAEKYHVRLYITHVSSKVELEMIEKAKEKNLPVFAEVTPHHLFLSDLAYKKYQGKALVNPPLRSEKDRKALWKAVEDGLIDCIGSDHTPHTLDEKAKPYGAAPYGMPGIETTLPLLLNAYHEGKISLQKIVSLTHTRIHEIFQLPTNDDALLIDLNLEKKVDEKSLATKVKWSCFHGKKLKGWPVYTILKGKVYALDEL